MTQVKSNLPLLNKFNNSNIKQLDIKPKKSSKHLKDLNILTDVERL